MRTGIGYDIHRLTEGRALVLGGVEIKNTKGLLGHSDADVLLHAITDALLGAAALGDIGSHFPDTDPAYKNADSRILLRKAIHLVRESGYTILNIDANIIAEGPRMAPHIDSMRKNIADDLNISIEKISIKARSNEGVGAIGRGEAIAAQAVATIEEH